MRKEVIQVIFTDTNAEFLVATDKPEHLITALIGIEGYLHKMTGLDAQDIRELCQEAKENVDVLPTGDAEITDIEVIEEGISC